MNIALLTILIGLYARCKHQIPGYPAYMSLSLRPGNPGITRRTLNSQSCKDPELVEVKTAVGHVRAGLRV
jgi:hypothetical protein